MDSNVEIHSVSHQAEIADAGAHPVAVSTLRSWLIADSPYIVMIALALVGLTFNLHASFWAILAPVFGVICVIAGWRHFDTPEARRKMATMQALSWSALILAIVVLYDDVVQGVLNSNATSLAMMTLLALGTFTAGVQARAWRICAVGGLLLVAVPGMSWLVQSPIIPGIATLAVLAIGFLTWRVSQPAKARDTQPEVAPHAD
jgi:hypothetical protein